MESSVSIFPNTCNSEYLGQVWRPTLAYKSLASWTSKGIEGTSGSGSSGCLEISEIPLK